MRATSVTQFNKDIDNAVLALVKKYDDFYMLIKHNQGIHPIDIQKSVHRLFNDNRIHKSKYKRLIESANSMNIQETRDMPDILPVPHILDYDWRFSLQGLEYMYKAIKKECSQHIRTIVFLGAPTLFKYCCNKTIMDADLILVDVNAQKHSIGIDSCNAYFIECDLNSSCEELDKIEADIVVMDPPWYRNYYQLFLDRAVKMCHFSSSILCVMPPKFTKASAEADTIELLKWLNNEYGFTKTHYFHGVVSYHTPPYEINALKANGINCIPINWRRGDLLIVKKTEHKTREKNEYDYHVAEPKWDEVIIDNIRIKFRHTDDEIIKYGIELHSVFEKNIYPTVKRSFGGRNTINVWTSGNRVYWCSNIPLFRLIINNIHSDIYEVLVENGYPIPASKELEIIEEVQNSIRNIVDLEIREYGSSWRYAI